MKKTNLLFLFVILLTFFFPTNTHAAENLIKTPSADISVSSENYYNATSSPQIKLISKSSFFQKVYSLISQNDPVITISDPQGNSVKEDTVGENSQSLNLEAQNPLPGRYTVNVNNQKAIEFYWGVLAINTNKSIYRPNEIAYLQMASLNSEGHTLCNSNLKLSVSFPDGTISNPSVEKSNECFGDTVVGNPDYYTYQKLTGIGTYYLQLTNLDNGFSVTDSFEVKDYTLFEIERIGPTRINPTHDYSMKIVVTANEDYQGKIEDFVPESFKTKTQVSRDVNLEAGETFEYIYEFDVPDISPELFLIGPLSIGNFKEARRWQIASDAIAFTNEGTSANPDINDGSNCTNPCSYANTSWTPPTSGLIVVFVHNRGSTEAQGVVPTVSGNNITWTQIATVAHGTTADVYTLFGADATSSSAGVTTFSYGSNLQLNMTASFFSISGVDLTGGVAAAFVQSPTTSGTNTSGSITLNAAGNSNNRAVSGWVHMAQEGSNFRGPTGDGQGSTDWTEVDDMSGAGPARGIETQYRSDAFETTASSSWTTSSAYLGIAAEIKAAASGITVAGTVYLANETTTATTGNGGQCDGSTANLSLRVNTGAATTTTCSSSNGTFSFSNVTASSGDTITIYSTATDKSNRVYVSDGTNDTGQDLYKNIVAVGDEADGTVTILDLLDYDSTTNDTDMLFDAVDTTTDTLTTESGIELHVHTGDTLDPGGTVTTGGSGNLHLDDSAIAYLDTATNTIGGDAVVDDSSNIHFDTNTSINGGDITVASGGDVTSAAGIVTMGASGTIGGGSTGSVFQLTNLTVSSGTTTLGADADNILVFDGDISVSTGATMAMNNKTADVNGGNVTTTSTGAISCASCSAGGITISGDGSTNGIGGGSGAITLYNLTLDGTTNTTAIGTSSISVLNNLTIGTDRTLTSASSGTISLGGNWSNSGTFTHNSGTVVFNAGVTGKTIDSGGTTSAKTFYDVQFNNSSGGWTLQTNNIKVAHNLNITDVSAWTLESGRTLEVDGTYSISDAETAVTTWTGARLFLNSGTSYTVGSKTQSAESYADLQLGVNTYIRLWNTSYSGLYVDPSSTLYSQDHGNFNGDLFITGPFHTLTNEYWSYATDFDGTNLSGGSERQVDVTVGAISTITVDSGDTLAAVGASANRTTVSSSGGSYPITVSSGGIINFQYTDFNNLKGPTGLDIQSGATVTSLNNTKYDNLVSSSTDSFITVDSSVIGSSTTTISGVQFDNTGSTAECNVNRTGSDSSGYWDFDTSAGTFDGEAYDCKNGANENDPGMIRWDDSGPGIEVTGNTKFKGLNFNGLNIQ